jgi:hypothetical protein
MAEWEQVSNQDIAADDTIELADGTEADITSVSMGPGGDIKVEVRIRQPASGDQQRVVVGSYALRADGHVRRKRPVP